jgi:CHAT domain-containing protein
VLETGQPDAELLAALAELALGDLGEEKTELHREIRFLTLSDRARAEATFQQRQPELIERLIKDSISQTRFRAEDSRVLFELTVPNELKSGLAQLDNLVLVVDDETAAYPWELMSAGTKPLCLAKGLVRQLQTSRYRPQIGARAGTAAYVVGDPVVSPPFQQLAGAREEARAVQRLLRARFEVTYRDEQLTALEVLSGLFARPYRIVHLAGHGHYEAPTTPGAKARSGMVLDSGIFLTAVEIQQMQQVPELVFLNCCHIGQTGPAAPRGAGGGVEFNRLAASVSRELIEMGVRAVVAAGWAVNDAAAKAFGEVFYGEMLDGNTFGRALKRAREETYGRFPESNTWGAYQAYGDPDYRLDPTGAAASRSFTEHVDAAEFVEAVRDIGRSARRTTAGDADGSKQRVVLATRLSDLVRDCPSEWLEQADVLMAIGYAYGDLGEFDRACHYLAPALADDGDAGTTTLRAVERLANFEARLADEEAKGPAARKLARAKLGAAIDRLVRLIAVAGTAERYALLGGAPSCSPCP